jgi:Protein of unknown function (DUF3306)
MTIKRNPAERFSLARWSRRKLQSAALGPGSNAPAVPAVAPPHLTGAGTSAVTAAAPVDLPPIESLGFDSDFTAFLRPGVDETLKRAALKQLFRDPRFNVMDGLDTYIDDYTKADPIPPDMLAELLERFDRQNAPPALAPDEPESASAHEPALSTGPAASVTAGDASCAPADHLAVVPAKAGTEVESRRGVVEDAAGEKSEMRDALGAPAMSGQELTATQAPPRATEPAAVDPTTPGDEHR